MGSEFRQISVPPCIVPELAERVDWNKFGRRVMIDAVEGIIVWMNPSGLHEDFTEAADETVKAAARFLGVRARAKRGTRWKRPESPKNTGLEADASFYVGMNAERWLAALDEGEEAAEEFEAAMPPDLVVEVEVTRFDGDKSSRYAALGVPEMWRVTWKSRAVEVEVLDLLAPGGPRQVEVSLALPGLGAALLPEAFKLARSLR